MGRRGQLLAETFSLARVSGHLLELYGKLTNGQPSPGQLMQSNGVRK